MSIQSDCELLMLETMEAYRNKYGISRKEVTDLFVSNDIFNKLIEQHEYLHQVSFEEALEYVENEIQEATV